MTWNCHYIMTKKGNWIIMKTVLLDWSFKKTRKKMNHWNATPCNHGYFEIWCKWINFSLSYIEVTWDWKKKTWVLSEQLIFHFLWSFPVKTYQMNLACYSIVCYSKFVTALHWTSLVPFNFSFLHFTETVILNRVTKNKNNWPRKRLWGT